MTPCEICKGACCETVIQHFSDKDELEWMLLRGKKRHISCVEFELVCKHLKDGRCSNYEDRPMACINYAVGSALCLETVERRRSSIVLSKVKKALNETG